MEIVLLLLLMVPAVALAAAQWWAVRLVRRAAAPAWAKWVIPALVTIAVVSSTVAVASQFVPMRSMDAADKATLLAASIAEIVNTVAVFGFPSFVFWLGMLGYFALRARREW